MCSTKDVLGPFHHFISNMSSHPNMSAFMNLSENRHFQARAFQLMTWDSIKCSTSVMCVCVHFCPLFILIFWSFVHLGYISFETVYLICTLPPVTSLHTFSRSFKIQVCTQ